MKPITVDTALALMNAYQSFSKGQPGKYTTEDDGVRYTLLSDQNQLRNGPIVTFKIEEHEGIRWVTRMVIPDINGVYATDSLVVQSDNMFIRILFKSDDLPEGTYSMAPIRPVVIVPSVPSDRIQRFS